MVDTHESRELTLGLINENTDQFPYERRCEIAREATIFATPSNWLFVLNKYADWYRREYPDTAFKPSDILAAAAEVADYYERHVAEMDAG